MCVRVLMCVSVCLHVCARINACECLYACVFGCVGVCTHARTYDTDQCHAHSNSLPLVQFIIQQHISSPS